MKEYIKAKGTYIFENMRTGEKTVYKNVVVQNFFTALFKIMSAESDSIQIATFRTGIGTNTAKKNDTALENQEFSKNVTNVTYNATQIKVITTLAPSESNFVIKECGLFFDDGGMLSRVNTNIEKNASTQYLVTYILEVI